jgi:hypothetical protein
MYNIHTPYANPIPSCNIGLFQKNAELVNGCVAFHLPLGRVQSRR